MFSNIPSTEPVVYDVVADHDLIALAELAAEGFGYSSYVMTPKDAVDALAHQLSDQVIVDDLGRRCVTRDTARALFAERAEAEVRQREVQDRRDAEAVELAAANRPRGGFHIPDGMSAAEAFAAAELADAPRRRTPLEDALANDGLTYYPIRDEQS